LILALHLGEGLEILTKYGIAGKLTGAGGGGFFFGLIPAQFSEVHKTKLLDDITALGFSAFEAQIGTAGIRWN